MKILHLVNDEKFIHFIADTFNSCEGVVNQFVVVVDNIEAPLKHVIGLKNMLIISKTAMVRGCLKEVLESSDCLVVHYLELLKMRVILKAPYNMPVVWSGWGGDYYQYSKKQLIGKDTSAIENTLFRKKLFKNKVKDCCKQVLKNFIYRLYVAKAMRRINFFSAPIPDDFEVVKDIPGFCAKYHQINYGSVEKTFKLGSDAVSGNNILVGNSALSSNNHIEVFGLLTTIDLKDRKIIVPLSYGNADYRDAVIKEGYRMFGDCFNPLVNFMPLDQYNNLISSCSIVIMGHKRQQALGNTATMLWQGAKVFLDTESTVYTFLKNSGANIYALDSLLRAEALLPLTFEEITKNRNILNDFWGHEVVLANAQHLVDKLKNLCRG